MSARGRGPKSKKTEPKQAGVSERDDESAVVADSGSGLGNASGNTPYTNRGCFGRNVPEEERQGIGENAPIEGGVNPAVTEIKSHPDYLTLTFWASAEDCISVISEIVSWQFGLDPQWGKEEKAGFVFHQGQAGVEVLECPDRWKDFVQVRLKGEPLSLWGSHRIKALLVALAGSGRRWRASRVDWAWDHVAMSPRWFCEQCRRGSILSRSLDIADVEWRDNHEGGTCYVGLRRAGKQRMLRLYDRRGFNRLEMEAVGNWAESMANEMVRRAVPDWNEMALGVLRGALDLVNPEVDLRRKDRPFLPEWTTFVGTAQKIKCVTAVEEQSAIKLRECGEVYQFLKTHRRRFAMMFAAWPGDWANYCEEMVKQISVAAGDDLSGVMERGRQLRNEVDCGFNRPLAWGRAEDVEETPF